MTDYNDRNQAIQHLAEALYALGFQRADEGPKPTIRLTIAPIRVTGADINNCHSIDLTPKQAEGLADAVDSMNAYLGSEFTGLAATVFAVQYPELAAEVADLFAEIDPVSLLNDVLNAPDPERAGLAYEDLTGDTDGDV